MNYLRNIPRFHVAEHSLFFILLNNKEDNSLDEKEYELWSQRNTNEKPEISKLKSPILIFE